MFQVDPSGAPGAWLRFLRTSWRWRRFSLGSSFQLARAQILPLKRHLRHLKHDRVDIGRFPHGYDWEILGGHDHSISQPFSVSNIIQVPVVPAWQPYAVVHGPSFSPAPLPLEAASSSARDLVIHRLQGSRLQLVRVTTGITTHRLDKLTTTRGLHNHGYHFGFMR